MLTGAGTVLVPVKLPWIVANVPWRIGVSGFTLMRTRTTDEWIEAFEEAGNQFNVTESSDTTRCR